MTRHTAPDDGAPIAILISTPMQAGGELGWRGFALPRLAAQFGAVGASLAWSCRGGWRCRV